VYLAQSMASMGESKQADESEKTDEEGEGEMKDGEAVAAGQGTGSAEDRWNWELSEQARELIEQSQAASLPPKYEGAIKRYYERLSKRK
jgi:hypothetical protein